MNVEEIKSIIIGELGFYPPFFAPAENDFNSLKGLWEPTRSMYVMNMLPPVYKERFLAYTARFCTRSYCLVAHSCTLYNLAYDPHLLYDELSHHPPTYEELLPHLLHLSLLPANLLPLEEWPKARSATEQALFWSSVYIFLHPHVHKDDLFGRLQRVLRGDLFTQLSALISYSHLALSWADSHPELDFSGDFRAQWLVPLISMEPRLNEFIDAYKRMTREQDLQLEIDTQRVTLANTQLALGAVETACRSKSEFISNISHEIRTPMNTISGMATLMATTNLTQEQQEYVNGITSGSEMLLTIVNNLLDIAKMESKAVQLNKAPFSIHACVGDVIGAYKASAVEKKLELSYRIEDDVPRDIIHDAVRTRQVLSHLVNNAIKFTTNGSVCIVVEVADRTRLKRAASQPLSTTPPSSLSSSCNMDVPELVSENSDNNDNNNTNNLNNDVHNNDNNKDNNIHNNDNNKDNNNVNNHNNRNNNNPYCGNSNNDNNNNDHNDHNNDNNDANNTDNNRYIVLQISVTDTGAGIPPSAHEMIFNPFTQLDSSSTRKHAGTGIGLTICRKIAHLMLGDIWVDSSGEQGKGSTFVFYFPCQVVPPSPTPTHTPAIAPTLVSSPSPIPLSSCPLRVSTVLKISCDDLPEEVKTNCKFLIVDDNATNLKLMGFMLRKLGIKNFKTAENGKVAVDVAKSFSPDLIFMDVNMPVMDGLDATRIIKKQMNDIIIIGVTAYAFKEDLLNCIAAGMDDVLPKPIKLVDISNSIKKWRRF